MDCFDMYEKYVKPEDDALALQLQEQATKEDNNLWDDAQADIKVDQQGGDQPKDVIDVKSSNLSEADVTAIAEKMVELMRQKGGNNGDEGTG